MVTIPLVNQTERLYKIEQMLSESSVVPILTEDSSAAALNSPELYKLKDRFPIQIDLESSDVKEICYRRFEFEQERKRFGDGRRAKLAREVKLPRKVTSAADLDTVIRELGSIKSQAGLYAEIEVSFVVDQR